MSIPWLAKDSLDFPPIEDALKEPSGLLAAGGDLSPQRLIQAYQQGIFPWFESHLSDGSPSPILWWCPDPRCVLSPDEINISRSLKKRMRNGGYTLSCNAAFEAVITSCAGKRKNSQGTWIHPDMVSAYCELNQLAYAHSIECWLEDRLLGGLYGVSIGRMFYGESMFSHAPDSSKIALVYLCKLLKNQGNNLIDCQISNPHLESMGAKEIPLSDFLKTNGQLVSQEKLHFPNESIYAEEVLNL